MNFEDIVTFEFILFTALVLFSLVATAFFQQGFKKRKRFSFYLESMLIQMVNERIDMIEDNIPKEMLRLHYVIPIIEKLEMMIKDPFWDILKQRLIEFYLLPEIHTHILSDNWIDIVLAIRAIKHSPQLGFETEVLKHFNSKQSLLRFTTLDCALKFNTYASIFAALRAMAKEPPRLEYPYRDAFIYSNKLTHDILHQIYREATDSKLRLCCLKVLSLKVGYITLDDILWELGTDKVESHWWAIRALENCPQEESVALLHSLLTHKSWEIRALSIYSLSSLKIPLKEELIPNLIQDEHYWVQFMAALSLQYSHQLSEYESYFQGKGLDLFKQIKNLPDKTFRKGLKKFLPINQDPLLILESIGSTEKTLKE